MNRLPSPLVVTLTAAIATSSTFADEDRISPEDFVVHPQVAGTLNVIDAWIDGIRDYEKVPGISAGIVYDDTLIWSEGYGFSNLESERPADAETIYSICSISKLFTSIGIMQQRDAGRLRLSDRVSEHLDWFDIEEDHQEYGPPTIEGLLTHSSGLPRESWGAYWNAPDFPFPTREEMIRQLSEQQTLYPAHSIFQYSNLALTLAGEIVQETSGTDYQEYIQSQILDPLKLEDTRTYYPEDMRGQQLAIGYTGLDRRGIREPVNPFFTRAITPAAGFTSTVNDLGRFAIWQFATLDGEENEILERNTLREMQRVHWVDPDFDTTWGLGFSSRKIDGDTAVGHGGGCPGYITQFVLMPRYRIATIVLTNAGDGPANNTAVNMIKQMRTAVRTAKRPFRGETPDYSAYEGNYAGPPWGGETAVRQKGDRLILLDLPSYDLKAAQTKLKHVEGDVFVRLTDDNEEREQWVFTMGENSKASKVLRHGFEMYRLD